MVLVTSETGSGVTICMGPKDQMTIAFSNNGGTMEISYGEEEIKIHVKRRDKLYGPKLVIDEEDMA